MVFLGGALTGPYPTLQFSGACGLVIGHGIGGKHIPAKWRNSLKASAGVSDDGLSSPDLITTQN
jgi:hypothetical protein